MWKLFVVIVCALVSAARAQDDTELDSLIAEVFGVKDQDINTDCDAIVDDGRLDGCAECYPCAHRIVASFQRADVIEITINNSTCHQTRVCCVRQVALLMNRIGQQCGVRKRPGTARLAPRAVLEGEYPWHAYLYGTDQKVPLCAATYIDAGRRALLTTATCARAGPRTVRFWRGGRAADVDRVVVHEGYGTGDQHNLALVLMRTSPPLPAYAAPACLPARRAALSTPCVTVAANDYLINTKIPKRAQCVDGGGRAPARPVLCAAGAGGDYQPADAAGLLCETREGRALFFELHGVYLHTNPQHTGLTLYVNTTHYLDWINEKLAL